MTIQTEKYLTQKQHWPLSGRHILASFDVNTIVVYQAYSESIGHYAATHGFFGGGFSFNRMSWVKPNFLWMMYRSNWGQSSVQEVILSIRIRRTFFDTLLDQAVPSSFSRDVFSTHEDWKTAVAHSEVRLQWDPDHSPNGGNEERRAIQIGLRGATLESYGKQEIMEILDLSEFVAAQRENVVEGRLSDLAMPIERVYRPSEEISTKIGLSAQQ